MNFLWMEGQGSRSLRSPQALYLTLPDVFIEARRYISGDFVITLLRAELVGCSGLNTHRLARN
jgi:hypothetical protein